MKSVIPNIIFLLLTLTGCGKRLKEQVSVSAQVNQLLEFSLDSYTSQSQSVISTSQSISMSKDLLYDKYTLKDVYPYGDTVRTIKWQAIRKCLFFIDNVDLSSSRWCILQNYKNLNTEAPLVKTFVRNEYSRISDTLGVERYQSVPLYIQSDTITPVRYGRDGTLCRYIKHKGDFCMIRPLTDTEDWLVPERYIKMLKKTPDLNHVIFVDRGNQNIATLERISKAEWKIRSVNPATTGRHAPPYAQETPLGTYLLQQKKEKMYFLKDGSMEMGGYAPYASRFTNGAYIHGVPVNAPATKMIEYSWSLGTVPRSHMCVRNATSHSKFIFDWAPLENSLVVVIE